MLGIMLLAVSFLVWFRIGQRKSECKHERKIIKTRSYRRDWAKYPSEKTAIYQCTKCKDTKEVDF